MQQIQSFDISNSVSSVRGKFDVGVRQIGVDVNLGHMVHDHCDAPTITIVEDAVEKGRFSGTKKA